MSDFIDPKDLDKLQRHEVYAQLTPKQKKFLLSYIETRDDVASARLAYNCSTVSEHQMARCAMKSWRIRRLLALMGFETNGSVLGLPEIKVMLSHRLRDKTLDHRAFGSLLSQYMEVTGMRARQPRKKKPETLDPADEESRLIQEAERRRKAQ